MTSAEDVTPQISELGYAHMPIVRARGSSGGVNIFQSSTATEPCIRVAVSAPVDPRDPEGLMREISTELTMAGVEQLIDQLRVIARIRRPATPPEGTTP